MERFYVRATDLRCDNYTSFWGTAPDGTAWGPIGSATVYSQNERDSFHTVERDGHLHGFVKSDFGDHMLYVPAEGRWEELPQTVRRKTPEELHLDLTAAVLKDVQEQERGTRFKVTEIDWEVLDRDLRDDLPYETEVFIPADEVLDLAGDEDPEAALDDWISGELGQQYGIYVRACKIEEIEETVDV